MVQLSLQYGTQDTEQGKVRRRQLQTLRHSLSMRAGLEGAQGSKAEDAGSQQQEGISWVRGNTTKAWPKNEVPDEEPWHEEWGFATALAPAHPQTLDPNIQNHKS